MKFLGMRVEIPHDQSKSKAIIITELEHMLQRIYSCPLTRKQRLLLYRIGVCPRLSWLLIIEELPISWVEKNADTLATDFLKKWSGLARSANVAPLYLSHKLGGLNLLLISSLHKKLQVSRQGQLVTSQDPCVRLMAEKRMMREATLSRHKFRPGDVIREVMQASPNFTRKSLTKVAKALVQEEDQEGMKQSLQALPKQGHMSRCTDEDGAAVWGKALQCMGDEHIKFALNSAVDTLPHNANLTLWGKRESDACPLCGERQTLIHTLNTCRVACDDHRFNTRHDAILREIATIITLYLPPTTSATSDLGSYNSPSILSPLTYAQTLYGGMKEHVN